MAKEAAPGYLILGDSTNQAHLRRQALLSGFFEKYGGGFVNVRILKKGRVYGVQETTKPHVARSKSKFAAFDFSELDGRSLPAILEEIEACDQWGLPVYGFHRLESGLLLGVLKESLAKAPSYHPMLYSGIEECNIQVRQVLESLRSSDQRLTPYRAVGIERTRIVEPIDPATLDLKPQLLKPNPNGASEVSPTAHTTSSIDQSEIVEGLVQQRLEEILAGLGDLDLVGMRARIAQVGQESRIDEKAYLLTSRERKVLDFIRDAGGKIVAPSDIFAAMGSKSKNDADPTDVVRAIVVRVRRKLGDVAYKPTLIACHYGRGYRWMGKPNSIAFVNNGSSTVEKGENPPEPIVNGDLVVDP